MSNDQNDNLVDIYIIIQNQVPFSKATSSGILDVTESLADMLSTFNFASSLHFS